MPLSCTISETGKYWSKIADITPLECCKHHKRQKIIVPGLSYGVLFVTNRHTAIAYTARYSVARYM